jgi:hypothetical protein
MAFGVRPRLAICWLPVPHAMSSSVRVAVGPRPGQKRNELRVGRFLAMRRAIVAFRYRVVVDAVDRCIPDLRKTEINARAGLSRGPARIHQPECHGEELADWRAGRNAVYQLAALTVGARLAVADE